LKILPRPVPQKFNTFNTFNTFTILLFLSLHRELHPREGACVDRVSCLYALAVRIPGLRADFVRTPYSSGLD
jgi:hypothetical protein